MFLGGICFIALYRGNLQGDIEELIDILIGEGMPVDTYEFDNEVARVLRYGFKLGTALYTACDERNLPVVDALLIKHGADPYRLMKQCGNLVLLTPLQLASSTPLIRYYRETHSCKGISLNQRTHGSIPFD